MNKDQLNLNIKLDQTIDVTCESCEGTVFNQGLMLKKVSKFLTGTGQEGLIPITIFYCVKCNHVNPEFLPKEK